MSLARLAADERSDGVAIVVWIWRLAVRGHLAIIAHAVHRREAERVSVPLCWSG